MKKATGTARKKKAGTARRKQTTRAARKKTATARRKKPVTARRRKAAAARKRVPAHSYQEGSVESVGGRPSGTDQSDRSGDGTQPAPGVRPTERGRDAFVSSEIGSKTTVPGKDPRTRS